MKFTLFTLLLSIPFFLFAQEEEKPKNPELVIVSSIKAYKKSIKENPNNELVEIKKEIPNIKLDIRYATPNNFMKQVMYKQARAFARKPVVEGLKKVQEELNKQGLGLVIFDGYRPYEITVAFYKKASDKNFVANPSKGSKHNRGCAIDLSIIDLKTNKEIEMPTPYDSFAKEAAANYEDISAEAKKNRNLLITVMAKQNLKVLHNEWWHYDYVGWQNYDLMDIPFEKL